MLLLLRPGLCLTRRRGTHQPQHQQTADDPGEPAGEEHLAQAVGEAAAQRIGEARARTRLRRRQQLGACPAESAAAVPDGSGVPASRSAAVAPVVKTVPSTAMPTAKPSWRAVFTAPDAMPLRSRGTAASAAEARVGLAMPTPAPSTASPATSTRQVESASMSIISNPPTPISSSPPPRTNRGGWVCSHRPPAPATPKLSADSGMNTQPACSGERPPIDRSHSET